jgi:spermidine/putrescine transport system permease protein|uniref:ABC transporter permease n=1 Tax=Candidatus Scatomorpha intestinigallinarum TaxID=2840923 RepID=UPI00402667A8
MRTKSLAAPYIVWMVIFTVVPLAMVAYFAFTTSSGEFTLANMARASEYLPVLLRSVWYALAACVICLIIGYPVAYVIAQTSASTQRVLYLLVTLPMCMSFLLRTLAWVALLRDTGIINTLLAGLGIGPLPLIRNAGSVIMGMVYTYLPYMIMPLYTVISKLDPRLIEAAQDLGCDSAQVFRRVVLPLSMPGIVSGITMVFVPAVSTFYISQKLGGTNNTMIGDVIELQFKGSINQNLGAAMSLILMVLVFISIWLMNRFTDDGDEGVATI